MGKFINENPDVVGGYSSKKKIKYSTSDKYLQSGDVVWTNYDALAFAYHDDTLFLHPSVGGTHGDGNFNDKVNHMLKVKYGADSKEYTDKKTYDRKSFEYPGRLWEDRKIITFWRYPNKKQFKDFIGQLEKAMGRQIWNKGWYIEVYEDKDYDNSLLVPIEEYEGEPIVDPNIHIGHMDSPLEKEKKKQELAKQGKLKIPYDMHDKLKMEPAKWKFYKDKNIAELKSLIREIIKEEFLPKNII